MTYFEFGVLVKEVLIAAKNASTDHVQYEHVPERLRMIDPDVEFSFSVKDKDGKEIAVLDIRFDLSCYCGKSALECKNSLIKSGVAIFENADMHRALKASDIPFCKIEDLFDPMRMIHCGKDAEVYYAEQREAWN